MTHQEELAKICEYHASHNGCEGKIDGICALDEPDKRKWCVYCLLGACSTLLAAPRREPEQTAHYFTPDPTKRFCVICGDNDLGSVWGIHRFQIQPGDPDFKPGREPEEKERLLRAATTEPDTVADPRAGVSAGSGSCHGGMPHYCPNCDRSFMEAK